jgi:hypothetical protein
VGFAGEHGSFVALDRLAGVKPLIHARPLGEAADASA